MTENNDYKTPPTYWTHKQREVAFLGEMNPFWKQTLSSWKKLLKNTENRGFGFKAKNKAHTVEILFKTLPQTGGDIITKFKSWEEIGKT